MTKLFGLETFITPLDKDKVHLVIINDIDAQLSVDTLASSSKQIVDMFNKYGLEVMVIPQSLAQHVSISQAQANIIKDIINNYKPQ